MGVARGDLLNILLQTLPGIAITYQGEELVMEDVIISWEDTLDPQACNTNPQVYHAASRDPCRTPFPWDDSQNAGFSNAPKTWLPVGNNYKTVNVKAQETATNSHLKIFKKLVQLRKLRVMQEGTYDSKLSNNENVYVYKRELTGSGSVIVALNFGSTQQTVNLSSLFSALPSTLKVYTSSLFSGLAEG